MKLHVISKDEVREAISMDQAIETVKAAFAQLSRGRARVPVRTQLGVPLHDGVTLFMPAYLEETDELGMKMVSVFSGNIGQGLPTINAMVTLVDAETGLPTAILDGTYLTALRTGAASGAATDLLARKDATSVAVLGTGVQGRTQLRACCAVRSIDRVFVYDRSFRRLRGGLSRRDGELWSTRPPEYRSDGLCRQSGARRRHRVYGHHVENTRFRA